MGNVPSTSVMQGLFIWAVVWQIINSVLVYVALWFIFRRTRFKKIEGYIDEHNGDVSLDKMALELGIPDELITEGRVRPKSIFVAIRNRNRAARKAGTEEI